MGNIPLYTSRVSGRAQPPETRASDEAFGAAGGRALAQLGGQLQQEAGAWDAVVSQRRAANVDNLKAGFDFSSDYNALRTDMQPGGENFHGDVSDAYDMSVDMYLKDKNITDPKEYELARNELMQRKTSWLEKASNEQFQAQADKGAEDANDALSAVQNKVRNDPTQFDQALKDGTAVLGNQVGATADMKAKGAKAFTANLSYSYFQGLIDRAKTPRDFEVIRKELGDETWMGRLSPTLYERTVNDVATAENKIATDQRASLSSQLTDMKTRNDAGTLIGDDELKGAYANVQTYGSPQQQRDFAILVNQQDKYRTAHDMPSSQIRQRVAERTNWTTNQTGATKFLLGRLQPGKPATYITNLQPAMQTRLAALFNAAPPGMREKLYVISGYRSPQRQAELFRAAVAKYGSVAAARKWVAPPGRSQHNHGAAVDVGYAGGGLGKAPPAVKAWLQANAGKYGLKFPLSNEDWHLELVETRGGKPPAGGLQMASGGTGVFNAPANLQPLFTRYGTQYGVDPNVLAAMGMRESQFSAGATSPKGAAGVMQLMPGTAKELGVDPRNTDQSIAGAAKYMGGFLKKYGDLDTALAAYNWGPGNVDEWIASGRDPAKLPKETRDYIAKVHEYSGVALEMASQHGLSADDFYANQADQRVLAEQTKAFAPNGDMMTYAYQYNGSQMSNIDTPEGMAERGRQAMTVAQKYGIANDSATPLTQAEVDQRVKIIKDGSADDVVSLMGQLQALGPDMAKAAYRQLGQTDPVFNAAANAYEENPSVASDIIRGQKRITADKDFLKNRGATPQVVTGAFASSLGSALYNLKPEEEASAREAVLAHYAQTAAFTNSTTFDAKAFQKSVEAVVGNIDSVNGEPTLLPRGITGDEMDTALGRMTKQDFVDMSVAKLPPRYADGTEVPPEDMAGFRMTAIDGGEHYLFRTPDGAVVGTGVVVNANGVARPQPYVFTPEPEKIKALNGQGQPAADAVGAAAPGEPILQGVPGSSPAGPTTATNAPSYLPQTLGELDALIKLDLDKVDYTAAKAPDVIPDHMNYAWKEMTPEQRRMLLSSARDQAAEFRANNFDLITNPAFSK